MERPAIRRGGAEDEDLISGLPDELLHAILVRLPSAAAGARTSVLSRRWRCVWAQMPDLVLGGSPAPATTPSALLDSIDAALDSYAAPTLRSLKIDVSGFDPCDVVDADRIAPWLRFASQRVAGMLHLRVRMYGDSEEELALPICGRATEIEIDFGYLTEIFLRLPPTGSFLALTNLKIVCCQMDGGELGRVVSSVQCPCLRKLYVSVVELKPTHDISISSESLECLYYSIEETGKLEVHAPMLKDIDVSNAYEACIVAPKLENVKWLVPYDPGRHQFAMAGRHLRSLSIRHSTYYYIPASSTRLMERFEMVSELTVSLSLGKGIQGYMAFQKEMEKLPICETLVVHLIYNNCSHSLAPMVFHLLRRCSCIRKFKLILNDCTRPEMPYCTTLGCPCLLPENYRLDGIIFNSLEEIEINFFTGSAEQVEFVVLLLSRSNMAILKWIGFMVPFATVSSEIMEVVQRIRSMCHLNSKVQFNVISGEGARP